MLKMIEIKMVLFLCVILELDLADTQPSHNFKHISSNRRINQRALPPSTPPLTDGTSPLSFKRKTMEGVSEGCLLCDLILDDEDQDDLDDDPQSEKRQPLLH